MYKKITAIFLVLILLFSFAGCKKKDKEEDENNSSQNIMSVRTVEIAEETAEKIKEEIDTPEFGKITVEHSTNTSFDSFKNNNLIARGDSFYIGDYRYTFMKKYNGKDFETIDGTIGYFSVIAVNKKEKYEQAPYISLVGVEVLNFDYCFYNNTELKEFPLINMRATSASHCFDGCVNLSDEAINQNMPSFNSLIDSSYMFANCSLLKTYGTIPKTTKNADGMFLNCKNLETAALNSSAESINNIFKNCSNLTGTICFNSVPKQYNDAFSGTVKDIKIYSQYDDLSALETYANVKSV